MPNFGTGRLLGPPVQADPTNPHWAQRQNLAQTMMRRAAPTYNPNQQVGGGSIDMSHTIPAYTGPYGNGVTPGPALQGAQSALVNSMPGRIAGGVGSLAPILAGAQMAASTPFMPPSVPRASPPVLAVPQGKR